MKKILRKKKKKLLRKKQGIVKVSDLTIPKDYSLQKIGITQSLLTEYNSCKRKFLYRINKYAHVKEYENTAFGNLFHYILSKIYSGVGHEGSIIEYEKINQREIQFINSENWERIKSIVSVILPLYLFEYRKDLTEKNFLDVEKELMLEIPSGYKLIMKLDGRYLQNGNYWILENKTRGRIAEGNLVKRLCFDFQNLFYTLISERYYKKDIHGILYNLIRFPQIKPKKKESLKNYLDRLRKDIRERPEFYFMRFEIPYTLIDKQLFSLELTQILRNLDRDIFMSRTTIDFPCRVFYKNTSGCEVPYPCKFIDACSSRCMAGYIKKDKVFSELDSVNY